MQVITLVLTIIEIVVKRNHATNKDTKLHELDDVDLLEELESKFTRASKNWMIMLKKNGAEEKDNKLRG